MSCKASVASASTTHATTAAPPAVAASSSSSTPSTSASPNAPSGTTMTKISTSVSDKSSSSPQKLSSATATVISSTTVPLPATVVTKGTGTTTATVVTKGTGTTTATVVTKGTGTTTATLVTKGTVPTTATVVTKGTGTKIPQEPVSLQNQQLQQAVTPVIQNQKLASEQQSSLQLKHSPQQHLPQQQQINQQQSKAEDKHLQEKHSQGQLQPKQTQHPQDKQQQQMQQKQTDTQNPPQQTQQTQHMGQEKQQAQLQEHQQNHPQDKQQIVTVPKDSILQQQAQKPLQQTQKQPAQKQPTEKQPPQKQQSEKQPSQITQIQLSEIQPTKIQPTQKQSTEKQLSQKQSTEKTPPQSQPTHKQSTEKQPTQKQSIEKQPSQLNQKQPTEIQPTEIQPTQIQSTQIQQTQVQPTLKHQTDKQTTQKQPTDKQPTQKLPTEKTTTQKQSTEKPPTPKQSTEKQPVQPTQKQPTEKIPTLKQSTDKQPTLKQSTEKQPAQPTQKQPTEKTPTQKQSTEKLPTPKQSTEKQPAQPTQKQSSEKTITQKQLTDKQPTLKQSTEKQPAQPTQKQPIENQPTQKLTIQQNLIDKQTTQKQPIDKQPTQTQNLATQKQPTEKQSTQIQPTEKQPSQPKQKYSTEKQPSQKQPIQKQSKEQLQPQQEVGGQCGEKVVISASIGDKVVQSRPNLVTTTLMSPTKRSNSGSPQTGGQNISPLQINKTSSKGRNVSPTRSPRISPTRSKVSPTRDKMLPSVILMSQPKSPGPVNVTSTPIAAAACAAKSATAVAIAAAVPSSATSAKCQVVVSRGKNNHQRLPTIQSTDAEEPPNIGFTQKTLPSKIKNSTTAAQSCKSPTEKTPSGGACPGVGIVKKPPPSHRPLIRHNSLALVLGLFRGKEDSRDLEAGDGCKTLREESPEIMDSSSGGNNNSRSHSIPSTSLGGVSHFPEGVEARRIVPTRRRSCTSDLEILPEGPFVVSMSPPHSHAIKCKPLNDASRAAQVPRRCSLTLPYATLYGSWQSTVSPAGSRHGSNEITCGARAQRQHESHSTAQTPHGGQSTDIPEGPSSTSCYANSIGKQLPPSVITSPSSPDLHTSYSTQPLLDPMHLCGGGGPFGGGLLCRPYGTSNNTQLLASSLQKVPMKDFGSEVRASLDIGHFLQSAALILDEQECSLEGITDLLLRKLIDEEEPLCTIQEAKSILFTHDTVTSDEKESMSKVHLLSRTIQGTAITECGTFDYDQSWICALGNLPTLTRRHVAIARLKHPANMGRTSKQVKFFILVLCPSKEKGTKNSLETGRTFATIFADMDFRRTLVEAQTEEEFKRLIIRQSQLLSEDQRSHKKSIASANHNVQKEMEFQERRCPFARGLREDLSRRLPYYISDYKDGFRGHKTLQKVVSTTFFLYFACILPAIAFGVLNDHNTHGKIDVKKMLIGQVIGGLFYGVFSGQPLLVQLTTAPLAIYIKIIYYICEDFKLDFNAMYCAVGLWNSFFLVIYSLFDVSRLMRWSTRSTEEIFAIFISIAFCNDAFADVSKNFQTNYYSTQCQEEARNRSSSWQNSTHSVIGKRSANHTFIHKNTFLADNKSLSVEESSSNITRGLIDPVRCRRENSVLFLLLMFGTLWLGVMLYNFNKTPYLNASKREALADYALPVAVIVLSFIGSYVFRDIGLEHFKYDETLSVFKLAPLESLGPSAICGAMGLGFSLSMLFFMDQNIGSAMVNNPCNKLKKGPAYHLDLLVVALMNGFLSLYTLPWMHACLPHSPLHVRSLADVEERVDQGHVYEIIVKVRETRVTGLLSNILIGLSIFLLPYPLAYIPTAVLDGLFLYMAVTALNGNQMFERITLLFMEQAAYPPNHYIRRVPQRSIHQFTLLQVLQLLAMCSFGFAPWPYMKMMFPILLLLLLPVRHKLVPMVIEDKYLAALDGDH